MHFCSQCRNMYYIKLDGENKNKLIYYCRKCGNEDDKITIDNICVSKTNIKSRETKHVTAINSYTKLDPTLPRINTIRCPNSTCKSNTEDEKREVIYIRYDDTNIKYMYLCTVCDTTWKTNDSE